MRYVLLAIGLGVIAWLGLAWTEALQEKTLADPAVLESAKRQARSGCLDHPLLGSSTRKLVVTRISVTTNSSGKIPSQPAGNAALEAGPAASLDNFVAEVQGYTLFRIPTRTMTVVSGKSVTCR